MKRKFGLFLIILLSVSCQKGGKKIPTEIMFLNKIDGVPIAVAYEIVSSESNKVAESGVGSGVRKDLKEGTYSVNVSGLGWKSSYIVNVDGLGEALRKDIVLNVAVFDYKYQDFATFDFFSSLINIDLLAITENGKILIKSFDNVDFREALKPGKYELNLQYTGENTAIESVSYDFSIESGHVYRVVDLIDK
ncbi:MAG: hypothetical protein JXR63_10785 [Spirochaetales bacterium]|nr:hypothetical protein [Spirochaetales bacterium]